MKKLFVVCVLALLAGCGDGQSETVSTKSASVIPASMNGKLAKQLFGAVPEGSQQSSAPYGSYAKGCLAGGVELAETGPTWQAMRLSRNRNWGHPELIDFVQNLSRFAATQPGWAGLYVGDMSQPRGGPMLSGHRSHQIGLDADIWMLAPKRLNLSASERENISSISLRRSNGAYTNDNYTRQHMDIMKAAAKDPRVARIFVFPGAKVRMCKEEKGDKSWLRKVRPWWGHHYHFHVRLSCPKGMRGCVDQAAPPAGDGCADAQTWVKNILNPPPPIRTPSQQSRGVNTLWPICLINALAFCSRAKRDICRALRMVLALGAC